MKMRSVILLLLLCCLLSGCREQTQMKSDTPARAVYFLTETEQGRELGHEIVTLEPSGDMRSQILDTLEAMRDPINKNDHALLTDDIAVQEVEVFGSTVVVRLSKEYDALSELDKSLLQAGITLSLSDIEEVGYVRVTGVQSSDAHYMSEKGLFLDSDELRLSVFEVDIYPIDRASGQLFAHKIRILTEAESLSAQTVADEFLSANLGENAPFDGRVDIRSVVGPNEGGMVRVELYIPAEMDLRGREADLYSIVNSLFASRRVGSVQGLIGGSLPSERGLVGCDGPLVFEKTYIGEIGDHAYEQ